MAFLRYFHVLFTFFHTMVRPLINWYIVQEIGFDMTTTNVSLKGIGDESTITIANEKVGSKVLYDCSIFTIQNVLVVYDTHYLNTNYLPDFLDFLKRKIICT